MLTSRCMLLRSSLARGFARAARKSAATTFKEKYDKKIKVQLKSDTRFIEEEDRLDPNDPEIDNKMISFMHLKTQMLPEKNTTDLFKVKPELVWQLKGRKNTSAFFDKLKADEKEEAKEQKVDDNKEAEGETFGDRIQITKSERQATKEIDPMYSLVEYDENMAIAFLVRKMPETFCNSLRILAEIKYRFPKDEVNSILDFGAGLGSFGMAFSDTYPDAQFIVNVEPASAMRRLGKYISQEFDNMAWVASLADTLKFDHHKTFDVVSISNVLEEIPTPENRLSILEDLWQKVRPGGFMIIVEPGSPMGFRFINDTRNMFLALSRDEANIVAPCPHQETCPLAKKGKVWCNFEQKYERYPKNVLAKDPSEHMDKVGHFSYLIVKKGKTLTSSLLAETPQEKSLFWPRLLRPPMIRKGHVVLDLCNAAGEFERKSISKCFNEDDKQYKHARKMKWGDLWCFATRIPNRYRKNTLRGKRLW